MIIGMKNAKYLVLLLAKVYHGFYKGDVSFISDCMIEDVRDKSPMTTLYCGMTASKVSMGGSALKVVNSNPFDNTGIMKALNMHMLAYLNLAKASMLPQLKESDQDAIDLLFKNGLGS
jgi:hypothetical protein